MPKSSEKDLARWKRYRDNPLNKEKIKLKAKKYNSKRTNTLDGTVSRLLADAKTRSKKENLMCDLDKQHIIDILEKYEYKCPYFKTEFIINKTDPNRDRHNIMSIDRIIPEKGYIKGNIMVVSWLANSMKQDATFEQLLIFSKNVPNVLKEMKLNANV